MTTTPPPGNSGVQQYGGHSQVGNQAVGTNARAIAQNVGFQTAIPTTGLDPAALLALVERLLDQHREELPDQSATQVELRRIREELSEEEPQPGLIQRSLTRIAAFVEPVAPLVTAVAQLTQALHGTLG
ncbi:hypothetical protein CFP65_1699 [Kitasatospora sp. MMS16-BH015]|uniref:DUF5955 family protein n=1 Tax=Kitasatospora sp. MMS16-BH015 TaxID=2018025 RepID=UPI000CA308A5|nr:DUF5955 family protein [Kitasatospora sp. MMS16-BH015]AUG76581.1 hypothetical protein CFP65_1699 [Kitasatospora sp. MMS16-BH015]